MKGEEELVPEATEGNTALCGPIAGEARDVTPANASCGKAARAVA